jgi:hypothetical protein
MSSVSVRKARKCLRCGKRFCSLSSANRICPACKVEQFGPCAEPVRLDEDELRALELECPRLY